MKILARNIFYIMAGLMLLFGFATILTDNVKLMYVYLIIVGIILLIRRKIILEYFLEESARKGIKFDPVVLDVFYSIISIVGGMILIVIGAINLLITL